LREFKPGKDRISPVLEGKAQYGVGDPAYGKALRRVVKDGVEILAYDVKIDLKQIRIRKQIPSVL